MGFYFAIYTFLGVMLFSSAMLVTQSRNDGLSVPLWVHHIGLHLALFLMASSLAVILTTFINYGFVWALITIAELGLGALIAAFLPMGLKAMIVISSPITVVAILGAIWKFWYI